MNRLLVLALLLCGNVALGDELRWAADTESGAPSVFYDDSNRLTGFEKEIIEAVCRQLGKTPVFCQNDWTWLIPGLDRDLYDAVVEGLFRSEENEDAVLFSMPYYVCQLSLIVKAEDESIKSFEQCVSKRVGILCNSAARVLLKNRGDITLLEYPAEHYALADLQHDRLDAVLIDYPAAMYSVSTLDGLRIVDSVGKIEYLVAVNRNNSDLIRCIDQALLELIKSGEIASIVANWGLGNEFFDEYVAGISSVDSEASVDAAPSVTKISGGSLRKYAKLLPIFARAALTTIEVAVLGMILAVVLGLVLVLVRLYSPRWLQAIIVVFVEIIRGTPLLIQLFFIFYGLPSIGITLQPLVAGIVALGINYAAYESENFRAGLEAVPSGQMEAARALGMSQWQSLRYVVIPQAFSFVLPPLTNDFIAIIKESSLVSLITIVELTKAYTTVASTSFDFFGPGIIVAAFYLLLGLPFVRLAKIAENYLALEKKAYRAKRAAKKPTINAR